MKAKGLANPAARLFSNPAGAPPCPSGCRTCLPAAHCVPLPAGLRPQSSGWLRARPGSALLSLALCGLVSALPNGRCCHPHRPLAGDYGSMVNERVGASNWEDGDELGNTWVSRNAFR